MHKVLDDGMRTLLSLSNEEMAVVTRALRYTSELAQFTPLEYTSTFGIDQGTMHGLHAELHQAYRKSELVDVWEDHGAIMVRFMNCFGDPAELGRREASDFAERLQQAICSS